MLASQLTKKYRYENCAVVALGDGGAMVGAQIAIELHCVLTLLMTAEITLPRENDALAGITPGGTVAFNPHFSQGEIDEMVGENRGYVEQEKLNRMHDMNQLVGSTGTINRHLLRGHNVIVVSDGFKTSFPIDLAAEFLKPIDMNRLIFAAPLASVQAVDRMHALADDLYCLDVVADYMDTPHYYEKQDIPDHKTVIETIEQIILNWR